jgi:hypothetical protein
MDCGLQNPRIVSKTRAAPGKQPHTSKQAGTHQAPAEGSLQPSTGAKIDRGVGGNRPNTPTFCVTRGRISLQYNVWIFLGVFWFDRVKACTNRDCACLARISTPALAAAATISSSPRVAASPMLSLIQTSLTL